MNLINKVVVIFFLTPTILARDKDKNGADSMPNCSGKAMRDCQEDSL